MRCRDARLQVDLTSGHRARPGFGRTKQEEAMADETILVVEDNVMNMELITDILEIQGYTVLRATTGADALKLAPDEKPDL